MAEFSLAPAPKKTKLDDVDTTTCVFCMKLFTRKYPAVSPDISKLVYIFNACRERQDDIANKLLSKEEDIISGRTSIKYHRNCRASYQSPYHIKRIIDKRAKHSNSERTQSTSCGGSTGDTECGMIHTRSSFQDFDWKSKCFICSQPCNDKHRNTWSEVESIEKDPTGKNIYNSVCEAARLRRDVQITTRLLGIGHSDLVAVEARYHRKKGCLATYINPNSIAAIKRQQDGCESLYNNAICTLIEEYKSLIIEQRQVFLLSSIKERFHSILIDSGDGPPAYSSQTLKQRLQRDCPHFAFIPQRGKSDLVCSANVSVGEVMQKAQVFSQVLKDIPSCTDDESGSLLDEDLDTDEGIVHKAVSILRKNLNCTQPLDKEYYSSREMTVQAQKEFVDPLLLKAICWLTNKKHFVNATDGDPDPKCLNIACDITTLATSILSPKHVGLGIYLHHEYGSRKLVESMHNLGYSLSYDELRSFLTSAATFVTTNQIITPSGALVPREIIPKANGGQQVVCVADNWDHNEKTVDGRNTTHAMTSILVTPQVKGSCSSSSRIPRCPQRSLPETVLPGT